MADPGAALQVPRGFRKLLSAHVLATPTGLPARGQLPQASLRAGRSRQLPGRAPAPRQPGATPRSLRHDLRQGPRLPRALARPLPPPTCGEEERGWEGYRGDNGEGCGGGGGGGGGGDGGQGVLQAPED